MAYNFRPELSFIQSQTASSSASIVFSSGISTNFENYVVKLRNIVPATDAVNLNLDFSVDGGSTYLGSGSFGMQQSVLATITRTGINGAANTIVTLLSNVSTEPLNGELVLSNLQDAASHYAFFSGVHISSAGNITQTGTGIRNYSNTASVNAIKFSCSSGNIASGTFILYGVNEP